MTITAEYVSNPTLEGAARYWRFAIANEWTFVCILVPFEVRLEEVRRYIEPAIAALHAGHGHLVVKAD